MQRPCDPSAPRIALLLFLTLNFFFLLTSTGRVRTIDEVTVDFQAESMARHGSSALPQAVAAGLFYGKMDRTGQPRAPYGAGQAAIILPWHFGGRILRELLGGIPSRAKDIVLDAVVTSSSATFSALAAALAFLIFRRLGLAVRTSLGAAGLLALATPLFSYSAWFFSEPLATAILLSAALILFAAGEEPEISLRNAALAGALLGAALWVRPTHVLAAPVFLLALVAGGRPKSRRAALALAAVVGVFGAAYLLRNQIYFGNPFDFGYPAAAESGKRLNSFETPLATGLFGFLLSPGKSIFLFAPPVLLAIPGVVRLARRNRGLAIVAGVTPLVYLFFYARYTQWEGGYCYGPRYLVPVLALLCLSLGPMLGDASPGIRKAAVALLIAGFFVQAVGISTSFLEDQANGSYYDQLWNYRLSYSPLVSMSRKLLHYAASPVPAPIGRGFDRWFVFLAKAGVSRGTIAGGVLLQLSGLLFFGWRLRQALPPPAAHDR